MKYIDKYPGCEGCPVYKYCGTMVGSIRLCNSYKPKPFRSSTDRQKLAVRYCEAWLDIRFIGDIDNFASCSEFLREHLELAKATEKQTKQDTQDAVNQAYLEDDAIGDYDDAMG